MQGCKPGDIPIVNRDKFSLNQCPKDKLKEKEIQKTPHVLQQFGV